jgi:hypothetical protein
MATSKGNGIGIGTVLFCIFLVLKLTNHIDWSWWWVTSPLWLPLVIGLSIAALAIILALIIETIKKI